MNNGLDGTWRVWTDLEREEEKLKWGEGLPGHGPRYDTMGRPAAASSAHFPNWFGEQASRVGRVRAALHESGPLAARLLVQTFSGISIAAVVDMLISIAVDFALYYGGAIITGGILGGVAGAFVGGVGAVPGAALGASAGGYVGTLLMTVLGVKSLVEGIAHAIPEALKYYSKGFAEAWGPIKEEVRHGLGTAPGGNSGSAAMDLAQGHLILVSAMLTVMLAYLSRGKGEKDLFLQEVKQSRRLGPKMATWLEQNEERLRRHPALQSRSRSGSHGGAAPPPQPPKRQAPPRTPRLDKMPKARVPCFKTKGLPQGNISEFERQLTGQQAGINNMTVEEYLTGRDAFDTKQSIRDPSVARKARAAYEATLVESLTEELQAGGLSPKEAEEKAMEQAAAKMKTLAALHNPDMVAGGKDVIADFGNENVNKRIGAQWNKGGRLAALDEAAMRVPEALRSTMKMNASLVRCK